MSPLRLTLVALLVASTALFGVDTESTPLIVLAVFVGLALAAVAATSPGRTVAVLIAIAVIALAWAALDAREAVHQIDESNTGVAIVAIAVTVLHLAAAATAGLLAAQARHPDVGRAGTMPA
jgi:hypothetical protein